MPSQHSILDDLLADEPQDVDVFVQLIGDLAEQVKSVMAAQGLTRRALAQRLGKSESEITKWLSGLHNLTLQSVAKLSVALQQDLLVTPAKPQGYFGQSVPVTEPVTQLTTTNALDWRGGSYNSAALPAIVSAPEVGDYSYGMAA